MNAILRSILVCILISCAWPAASRGELPPHPPVARWSGPWLDSTLSRQDVIRRVSDTVKPATALRYGTFENYWRVAGSSKTGKFAEAHAALHYQRFVKKNDLPYRVAPTALRDPSSPFDLVVQAGNGRQMHYQMKLGFQASVDAIDLPKYAGGRILTPPDTLTQIRRELQSRQVSALKRGVPLDSQWRRVERAIASGRLTDELPGRFRVAARGQVERVAERHYLRVFNRITLPPKTASQSAAVGRAVAVRTVRGKMVASAGRVVGRAGGPLAAATSLYGMKGDIARYQAGKADEVELTGRLATRGALVAGGVYAAVAASGPVGWAIGGAAVATEIGLTWYDHHRDVRFQRTLAQLERADRYAEARTQVMAAIK